ncbi:MAG: hypothetical protein LUG46_06720 [Erysipelotrichaceae bacterium]|nr:hypothetical protein [Erysipelotrichaceae bacterium]
MKNNKQIIIATHGELADGFSSALKIIVGDVKNLHTLCCYTTPDFDLNETIEKIMNNHDFEKEDLVICTDMMGGSVNNGFVKYLAQYPFHLITNTNLTFLVELLLTPGSVDIDMLEERTHDSLSHIKYVNVLLNQFDNETDDI